MTGGRRGVRVIDWGLNFWSRVIFGGGVCEKRWDFLRSRKKQSDFLGCEKRTKGFFWVC